MVEKENSTVMVEVVRTVLVEIKMELETIMELETAVEVAGCRNFDDFSGLLHVFVHLPYVPILYFFCCSSG